MKQRVFETVNGKDLIIKHRKPAVIFEVDLLEDEKPYFDFYFTEETFKEFVAYIETIANEIWPSLIPKDATSEASDYSEYYDKEFDNNGYLGVGKEFLEVEGPHTTTGRLYQFNKAKMQSFIFDLRKLS